MSEKEDVNKEPDFKRESFDDFEKSYTHDRPEPQDAAPRSRPPVTDQQNDQETEKTEKK